VQPYVSHSSSTWRPSTEASAPFTSGSSFQLSSSDLPSRAVALVQDQHLHQKFGDFDDHLEDVAIGELFVSGLIL
jgi:ER membrane protein complex subunit 8/9